MIKTIFINGVMATQQDYDRLCEDYFFYNTLSEKPSFLVKTIKIKDNLYIETIGR